MLNIECHLGNQKEHHVEKRHLRYPRRYVHDGKETQTLPRHDPFFLAPFFKAWVSHSSQDELPQLLGRSLSVPCPKSLL